MKRRFLLIMLLMAMFAPLAMQAQVLMEAPHALNHQVVKNAPQIREAGWLQYDDGVVTNNYGLGANTSWTYGAMYPSSMLGDNNSLTKVAFYENNAMSGEVIFTIYSGGDTAPGTLIYTQSVALNGSSGMHEVDLNDAVTIDPDQNLWIITTVDASGNYVIPVCASTETNNDWFMYNNNWYHWNTLVGLTGTGWLIRGYVEYIEVGACPKPTQFTISNVTTNSADLSWNGDARSYQLVYSNREGFNPDSATPIDVNETSYTLTNLTDGTTYYAYVRANCGDSYSEWNSKNFTTISACATPYNVEVSDITPISANISWDGVQDSYTMRYMVPSFYDGFENDLEGWTVYTQGTAPQEDGWYTFDATNLENGTNHNGNNVACSWSWSTNPYSADNYLVTPQVTFGSTLLFWEYTNANYPDSYEVLLSTTGNAIADFTVTLRALQPASTEGWHQVAVDLSAYANQQGYIAIHHVDYDMNYLFIDDFCIGNWTPVSNVASPYAFANLTPETTYVAQIQGICPGGTTEWSDGVVINTPSSCQGPSNPASANVTGNSATLSWEGYQDSYNIQYRTAADRVKYYFTNFNTEDDREGWTWTGSTIYGLADPIYNIPASNNYFLQMGWATTDEAYIISPELPEYGRGATVEFYHFYYNSANTFQIGYSTTTSDETAFSWSNPINAGSGYTLYSDVLDEGIKYIAFKATASDQGHCIFIDNFGIYGSDIPAGSWVTINNVTSPYTLPGLAADTQYEWQVNGINTSCDGGVTEWSESAFFTTLSLCEAPTELAVEVTTNSAVLTWTSEANSFDVELDGEVIAEDVTETTYTINDLDPGTIYTVRVMAHCDEGDSEWSAQKRFLTDCEAFDLPYETGFESDDYLCWDYASANEDNPIGFYYEDETYTNTIFQFGSYYETEDGYDQALISPELNTEAAIALQFSYQNAGGDYGYVEEFAVLYSTTTNDLEEFEALEVVTVEEGGWLTYQGTLPAGTKYMAVYYMSEHQSFLLVDNFSFTEVSGVTQSTDLYEGWNLFSSYIAADGEEGAVTLLDMLKESLGENGIKIMAENAITEYEDEEWFGDLDEIGLENEVAYYILVSADCTAELEGMPANPADYEIEIHSDWNQIGFPSAVALEVADALSEFEAEEGDLLQDMLNHMTEFDGEEWFGDLEEFEPGQGYMYYSTSEDTKVLVYQTGTKVRRAIPVAGKLQRKQAVECRTIPEELRVIK